MKASGEFGELNDPLAAFRRGDELLWESLVEENLRWLTALAFRIVGHSAEAEDAAQECFIRAYRSRAQLREWSHRRAWLRTICVRLCVKHPRRQEFSSPELVEQISSSEDQLRAAEAREELEGVLKTMERLSPRQRTCLVLTVFEEMSGREIAESLEISESSVRGYVFEARRLLKSELAKAENIRSPKHE